MDNTKYYKRIVSNTSIMYFSQGFGLIAQFIFVIFTSRYLGTSGIGQYYLAGSFLAILSVISRFGFGEFLVREIARNKNDVNKYFINTVIIRLVSAILFLILFLSLLRFFNYSFETNLVILIICISLVPLSITSTCQSVYQAYEKMKYIAYLEILTSIIRIAVGIPLLLNGYGIIHIAFLCLILSFISLIASLYILSHYISKPKIFFDITFTTKLLKQVSPFFIISIFVTIFYKIDIIMLSKLIGTHAVGIYGAAHKFLVILMVAVSSYNISIYPILSSLFKDSKIKFFDIFEKTLKYEIMLIVPVVVLFVLFSDKIVLLVFGDEFIDSIIVLKVIIISVIPYSANYTFSRAILASNNQRITLRVTGFNVIANIALNFILIPYYGALGAAVATLITLSIAAIQNFIFIQKNICRINLFKIIIKPLLSITSGIFIFVLLLGQVSPIILSFLLIFSYLLFLFITKSIQLNDIRTIRRMLIEVAFKD